MSIKLRTRDQRIIDGEVVGAVTDKFGHEVVIVKSDDGYFVPTRKLSFQRDGLDEGDYFEVMHEKDVPEGSDSEDFARRLTAAGYWNRCEPRITLPATTWEEWEKGEALSVTPQLWETGKLENLVRYLDANGVEISPWWLAHQVLIPWWCQITEQVARAERLKIWKGLIQYPNERMTLWVLNRGITIGDRAILDESSDQERFKRYYRDMMILYERMDEYLASSDRFRYLVRAFFNRLQYLGKYAQYHGSLASPINRALEDALKHLEEDMRQPAEVYEFDWRDRETLRWMGEREHLPISAEELSWRAPMVQERYEKVRHEMARSLRGLISSEREQAHRQRPLKILTYFAACLPDASGTGISRVRYPEEYRPPSAWSWIIRCHTEEGINHIEEGLAAKIRERYPSPPPPAPLELK